MNLKNYLKKAPYLCCLLVIPFLGLIYGLLNSRAHNPIDITTTLDSNTPFIPIFIIPYILWYAYLFCYLGYFCFKDIKIYFKSLILIVAAQLICFVIYFFFQTTVPRPTLESNNFILRLVDWIYSLDRPYNCFPSIHVLTTFVVMLVSKQVKYKYVLNTICIHLAGTLIIVSTLFVKQHVIIDMIGSIVLVTLLNCLPLELLLFKLLRSYRHLHEKS
nr:phosphatase PAP2 family protein [Peribacillus loiseleuriae]